MEKKIFETVEVEVELLENVLCDGSGEGSGYVPDEDELPKDEW